MRTEMGICWAAVVLMSAQTWATVNVQASTSGVQKGGTITFTATTTESDPVVKVTFSYEGTATTDEITSSPYQVTKVMDWVTMQNLTVTATFDFQNIPDQQGTVDVDVVDITLQGPSQPTRGSACTYTARTSPTGLSVSSWSWSCTTSVADANYTDTSNSDDASQWRGTMVASGTIQVAASVVGIQCTKSISVSIRSRTGTPWTTPIACVEDNEPNWGARLIYSYDLLGDHRDRESNAYRLIVPQTTSGDWSDAVTLLEVSSGPNKGIWYIQSTILEVDLETVINRYAKWGGPPPEEGATNFYDYNNDANGCIPGNMDDFIQAVMNHEYRGTPPTAESLEGHFGRIEYGLAHNVDDPSAVVEGLVAASESALLDQVNDELYLIQGELSSFAADGTWSNDGPNWGGTGALGSGKHTRYNGDGYYYSGCTFGPDHF